MDKAILVMEMPESCWQCNLHNYHFCDVTGYCVDDFMNSEYRPDWCPLKPVPEKYDMYNSHDRSYEYGYNDCLEDILGGIYYESEADYS